MDTETLQQIADELQQRLGTRSFFDVKVWPGRAGVSPAV